MISLRGAGNHKLATSLTPIEAHELHGLWASVGAMLKKRGETKLQKYDFDALQNINRITEKKYGLITLMCTPKAVKNLRWAVTVTLHELREDLKEAVRVENSGAIARDNEAIKEFEAILNALPNSPFI